MEKTNGVCRTFCVTIVGVVLLEKFCIHRLDFPLQSILYTSCGIAVIYIPTSSLVFVCDMRRIELYNALIAYS